MESLTIFTTPVLILAAATSLIYWDKVRLMPLVGALATCGALHLARGLLMDTGVTNADILFGVFLLGGSLYTEARHMMHKERAKRIALGTGNLVAGIYLLMLIGGTASGASLLPAVLYFISMAFSGFSLAVRARR